MTLFQHPIILVCVFFACGSIVLSVWRVRDRRNRAISLVNTLICALVLLVTVVLAILERTMGSGLNILWFLLAGPLTLIAVLTTGKLLLSKQQ